MERLLHIHCFIEEGQFLYHRKVTRYTISILTIGYKYLISNTLGNMPVPVLCSKTPKGVDKGRNRNKNIHLQCIDSV